MRIANGLAIVSSLLLATGCATDERRTEWSNRPAYGESTTTYGTTYGTTGYNGTGYRTATPSDDKYSTQGQAAASQLMNDNDRTLCYQVRQQFDANPNFSTFAPNVSITCHNGVATLSGTVPTDEDRMALVAECRRMPGIASVHDELQIDATAATGGIYVAPPASPQPTSRYDEGSRIYGGNLGDVFSLHVMGLNDTDRSLAQRILEGLRTDSALPALLPVVNIDVSDGQVILRGTVQSGQQRRAIVSAVQRAVGANNVSDQLQVQVLR
jgi:osmotically-inducible protein OsmY